jgi:putative aldouronate transport system permease protein
MISDTNYNIKDSSSISRSEKHRKIKRMKYLYLLILLPFIHQLIFSYVPLYGIVISFKNFKFARGIWGSEWNNFQNYYKLFRDPFFKRVFFNTLKLSVTGMLVSFPSTILFALLLNEISKVEFKKVVQTISYLPHFMSWVVIATFIYQLLSPENGFLNSILIKIGAISEPIYFMGTKKYFLPVYLISGLWAGIGWGSIIYLSAIAGIDISQYESAELDGANRFHKIIYITLPGIMPTATVLLILSLGSILNVGFDRVFNLYNPLTYEVADVISTFVFRKGLMEAKYDYAAAVGLFQNVIGFSLVMVTNYFAKKFNEYTLI